MGGPSSRTLQRALELVGSRERLCAALLISAEELGAYLQGIQPVPNSVFLRALDIVAGQGSNSPGR